MDDGRERYRLLMGDVYELAGLSRRLSGRDAAVHGATAAQWQVLSVLDGAPTAVPQIAERLGLTRQGGLRVVGELAVGGAVRRCEEHRHRRSPRMELTVSGRTLLATLWDMSAPRRARVMIEADIDGEQLDVARETIRRLIRALRRTRQSAG